jgi:hypothetical protein
MSDKFIIVGGILTIIMAVLHTLFPGLFDWKSEFEKIGPIKGKVHYTIHLALILFFVGIGTLSILFSRELSHPHGIGLGLLVTLASFWLWRTIWQVFYFRLPKGPKPKGPVAMYYVMTILFVLLTVSYACPVLIMRG